MEPKAIGLEKALNRMVLSSLEQHDIVVLMATDGEVSEELLSYYELRKEVFLDELGWTDIEALGTMELDEYDTDRTVYVLAVERQTRAVEAGVRLNPTDHDFYYSQLSTHPTTYMLRDAYLGKIPSIPPEICVEEPPVNDTSYEATRLVAKSNGLFREILMAGLEYLQGTGAQECLFLTSPRFKAVGTRMGLGIEPLGPKVGDGAEAFQAFVHVFQVEEAA